MSIDQQFVEFVVKSLVSKPDEVQVERRIDEKGVLLELTVDPEDLGRVIGKRGATAQSIRTLLRALGTKNDARYNLKIVDNGPEDGGDRPPRREKREKKAETEEDSWSSSESEEPASEPEEKEDSTEREDALARTRKELADLDDLEL